MERTAVGGWNVRCLAVVILTAMGSRGDAHGQEKITFRKYRSK